MNHTISEQELFKLLKGEVVPLEVTTHPQQINIALSDIGFERMRQLIDTAQHQVIQHVRGKEIEESDNGDLPDQECLDLYRQHLHAYASNSDEEVPKTTSFSEKEMEILRDVFRQEGSVILHKSLWARPDNMTEQEWNEYKEKLQ